MDVVLRKTKITKSIMDQMQELPIAQVYTYTNLGWCIHRGIRYMVFFQNETHDIRKYKWIQAVELEEYNPEPNIKSCRVVIKFGPKFIVHTHTNLSLKEAEDLARVTRSAWQDAQMTKQFFI